MSANDENLMNDAPLVCSLSEAELVQRRDELSSSLFDHVQEVRELADGYAFRFPGGDDWASKLVKFIVAERDCCAFFAFELDFEPENGPIWLHMRGPQGVKEFIEQSGVFLKGATK